MVSSVDFLFAIIIVKSSLLGLLLQQLYSYSNLVFYWLRLSCFIVVANDDSAASRSRACAGPGPHVLARVLGPDDRPGPAFTTLQVVCCVSVIMLNGCLSSQVMSIRRLLYPPDGTNCRAFRKLGAWVARRRTTSAKKRGYLFISNIS